MTGGLDDSAGGPPGSPDVARQSVAWSALGTAVVFGVALVVTVLFQSPPVRAAGAQAASGGELYAAHCASCHQPAGEGLAGTFPPLAGNPAAADPQYVESAIRDGVSGPIEVLGVGYDTVMPPAVALTDAAEIQAVTQYVVGLASGGTDGQSGEPATEEPVGEEEAAEPVVAGPVEGDVDRGHDLFVGSSRFDNGGAACVACHTAGSVGNLGGPGLGPDLTGSYESLGGEAGLTGWLANPPSATMQPMFVDRPLSEAEVADVVAFLGEAADQDPASSGFDRLTVAGLGGLAALVAGMAVAWRGMRQTYVERLRSQRSRR